MTEHHEALVIEKLEKLKHHQRVLFALTIADRLSYNFRAYAIATSNNMLKSSYQTVLSDLWASVDAADNVKNQIAILPRVKRLIPEPEENVGFFIDLAQSAGFALLNVAELTNRNDVTYAIDCATLGVDSVWSYTDAACGAGLISAPEEWLENSPLVVEERSQQMKDIDLLASENLSTKELCKQFQETNSKVGIHPIRRGLIVS